MRDVNDPNIDGSQADASRVDASRVDVAESLERQVDAILLKAPDLVRYNTNFDSTPIKFFYAYSYPRNWEDSSQAEKSFRRALFNFKDSKNGGATQQIKDAIVNRVKKAVLSIGSIKDTLIVFMPSSAGAVATKTRWSDIAKELTGNESRLQVLDSDKCFISRPRLESYAKNNLADRKADQDVMKNLVINAESELFGKNVIILDDVLTTGVHVRQLGNALREKGASSITSVSLCCTAPQAHHTDSRYRFNLEHDDYCRKHMAGFKTSLDPMEDQVEFAKLYYKESPQMELLEDPLPLKRQEQVKLDPVKPEAENPAEEKKEEEVKKVEPIKIEAKEEKSKHEPIRIQFTPDKLEGAREESLAAEDNIKFNQIKSNNNMTKKDDAQVSAQVQTNLMNEQKSEQKKAVKNPSQAKAATAQKQKPADAPQQDSVQNQAQTPVQAQGQTQVQAPQDINKAINKAIDLPKEIKVAYANVSPILSSNGEAINVSEPRFATTFRLSYLNKLPSTLVTDKNGKEHHILDFAIVPNKNHVEGKTSPYLVIVKRNDAPAVYGGNDMKFVDKDAVVEFSLNRSQIFGKANSLGLKLDDTIQLHIGRTGAGATGVTLNPAEYKNVDKKSLELSARVSVVNSFDRTIKVMYNMNKIGENRYIDRFLGSAFGYQAKDKDTGMPLINQYTNMPITNFNFKLNRDDLRFLPEADKFGNVSIAIVKRDLTPEHLQEKGLHMEQGCEYPINDKGIKQPNYHIIADPKIYKNGEPNVNVVAVVKLNRAEIASLPYTTESFTTKEGKQVNNNYVHLSSDKFGNIKVNTKEYEFHQVIANDQKMTSKTTVYSDEICQKERQNWEQSHPRLSPEAFAAKVEMEKTMPNQFDIYRDALKALQPQAKQQEIQEVSQAQQQQPRREYKDYSQTADDNDPLSQSVHTKLPF